MSLGPLQYRGIPRSEPRPPRSALAVAQRRTTLDEIIAGAPNLVAMLATVTEEAVRSGLLVGYLAEAQTTLPDGRERTDEDVKEICSRYIEQAEEVVARALPEIPPHARFQVAKAFLLNAADRAMAELDDGVIQRLRVGDMPEEAEMGHRVLFVGSGGRFEDAPTIPVEIQAMLGAASVKEFR